MLRLTVPTLVICESIRLFRSWQKSPSFSKSSKSLNILVVRFDAIGDLIISSAALRELRRIYPAATITLLADSRAVAIAETCPYVDRVVCIPNQPESIIFAVSRIVQLLRFCKLHFASQFFDLVLVPRWDADRDYATIVSCYCQAHRRVWFSSHSTPEKKLFNWGFSRYYTDTIPSGELKHEVERGLDMVRYLGAEPADSSTELWLTRADTDFAEGWWADNGLDSVEIVIACALGATKAQCRWPAQEYARLIDRLSSIYHGRVATLLICAPHEAALAQAVINSTNPCVLLPKTSNVRQAAALIAKCSALVGNNSGPIHIAAAAGVPVVEISCHPLNGDPADELNPKRFGAFSTKSLVVQPPRSIPPCTNKCDAWHAHCITAVSTEDVSEAVQTAIASGISSQTRQLENSL